MKRTFLIIWLALISLAGCTRLYYASMERIGKEKRDILVQRILDAKKDQTATQQQLKTTLEAFQDATGFDGGHLEDTYKKLNGDVEDAQNRAGQLHSRIQSIDKVSNDLFGEWQKEVKEMKNRDLKSRSTALLRAARVQQASYMRRMRQTEQKITPVLQAFKDQVLFLKHNLNASAIQSLKTTAASLNGEVADLIKDIDRSALEADSFIKTLSTSDGS